MDVVEAVRRIKKSEDDLSNLENIYQQAITQRVQGDALKNVGNLALLGVGTGMGLRGLQGLFSLINRNRERNVKPKPRTVMVDVPYAKPPRDKVGEVGVKSAQDPEPSSWFTGGSATTVGGIPAYWPAAVGALGLGGVGGWKLIDYILDKRRSQETTDELDQARVDYEKALRNEPAASQVAGKFAEELDKLAEAVLGLEKKALGWQDILGGTTGLYLGAYALPSSVLAATIAYNMGKKRQRKVLLEQAQKKRMREMSRSQPVTLLANPSPVRSIRNVPQHILTGEEEKTDQEDPQRYAADA